MPTDNPNDPLNSKPFKKFMIVANCCWFGKLLAIFRQTLSRSSVKAY